MYDALHAAVEVLKGGVPADGSEEDARDLLGGVMPLVGMALRAVPRWTLQRLDGQWTCVFGFLRDGELVADGRISRAKPMEAAMNCIDLLTAQRDG